MYKLRTYLLAILAFLAFTAQSQEYDEVIEEEEVEVEPAYYSNSSRGKSNYQTRALIDNYKLIYTSDRTRGYSYLYGIQYNGKQIMPMIFSSAVGIANEYKVIMALGTSYGIYNLKTATWDVPLVYTSIANLGKNIFSARKGNSWGVIDSYNKKLVDFKYSNISKINGLDNYVIISTFDKPYPNKGIYNILRNEVTLKPQYKNLYVIRNQNILRVQNQLQQYNLVDVKGNLKFKNWYKELTPERGGRPRYIVKRNGKMGIIDDREIEIVPITYNYINASPYTDGSYLAQNSNGKYGLINIDGKVTLPFDYDNFQTQNYSGIAISSVDNKCGLVKLNNGAPYELATCDYDEITINNNLFVVKQKGKSGIMDISGRLITELVYDELTSILYKKTFLAKKGKNYMLLNNFGERITENNYLDLAPVYQFNARSHYSNPTYSYLKVKFSNGKYGLIDQAGSEIIGGTFDEVESEIQNKIVVKQNGKYGLYNLISKKLDINAEYDQLTFNQGTFYGFKGKEIFLIKTGAKVITTKLK